MTTLRQMGALDDAIRDLRRFNEPPARPPVVLVEPSVAFKDAARDFTRRMRGYKHKPQQGLARRVKSWPLAFVPFVDDGTKSYLPAKRTPLAGITSEGELFGLAVRDGKWIRDFGLIGPATSVPRPRGTDDSLEDLEQVAIRCMAQIVIQAGR